MGVARTRVVDPEKNLIRITYFLVGLVTGVMIMLFMYKRPKRDRLIKRSITSVRGWPMGPAVAGIGVMGTRIEWVVFAWK